MEDTLWQQKVTFVVLKVKSRAVDDDLLNSMTRRGRTIRYGSFSMLGIPLFLESFRLVVVD